MSEASRFTVKNYFFFNSAAHFYMTNKRNHWYALYMYYKKDKKITFYLLPFLNYILILYSQSINIC